MSLHQTAKFGLALQSAKGTAAAGVANPYIRGRMQQHGMNPRFDQIDTSGEHTGVHTRSTALQSTPIRSGHIMDVAMRHRLYPSMIGYELLGVGFAAATSTKVTLTVDATGGTFTVTAGTTTAALAEAITSADLKTAMDALSLVGTSTITGDAGGPFTISIDSTFAALTAVTLTANGASLTGGAGTAVFSGFYYSHAFTLPAADSEGWLTAYDMIGETSGFDKIVKDIRLSQLQITADNTGLVVNATGLGLGEADAAGTETFTAEVDAAISQANGSFTLSAAAGDGASDITAATMGTPRGSVLTIDNPLDDSEQQLHSFARATLSPTGKAISGTLSGLVHSENLYKEFTWGGSGGTAPVIAIPNSQLTWTWNSPGFITGAIPYSLTALIPNAQMMMQPFDIAASGSVLFDVNWTMLDNISAAPITFTLTNTNNSYVGT